MKKCPRCEKLKDESDFNKNKHVKSGLKYICKECERQRKRECYQKNKEEINKRARDNYPGERTKLRKERYNKNIEENRLRGRLLYKKQHGGEMRKYRKRTKRTEEERKQYARWRGTTLKSRYLRYKGKAKMRGRNFDLSLFDFATIIVQPCAYCGKKDGIYNGIDRIDNSKGYVEGNCAPCCAHCNYAKREYPLEEFKEDINRRFTHSICKFLGEIKEPIKLVI